MGLNKDLEDIEVGLVEDIEEVQIESTTNTTKLLAVCSGTMGVREVARQAGQRWAVSPAIEENRDRGDRRWVAKRALRFGSLAATELPCVAGSAELRHE